jgi:CheY-like chemotaxis protein
MQSGTDLLGPRPLVLVCDDTEPIRRLVRVNLELAGFAVEEAGDGHEAMARLIDPERPSPDVIVLDAQMAPHDGWWAIAAIRSHPRLGPVPVLLLTGSAGAYDAARADGAGFDGFLAKPFEPEHLVTAVSRLAEGGRAPTARP